MCAGQRLKASVLQSVVLDEYIVPDLDDLRVILIDKQVPRYFRTLRVRAAIHMDLTAGSTGTRVSHLPEIILLVS